MTAPLKIVVSGPFSAAYRLTEAQETAIRSAAGDASLAVHSDPASFRAAVAEADVVAGHLGTLPLGARLAWFHTWSAGLDGEPTDALHAAGTRFTCSKGNGAIPIAEHAILTMLMVARRAVRWIDAQRAHEWRRQVSPELHGATLGVIGLGHIGQEVVRRAAGFGMRCLAQRRTGGPPPGGLPIDRIYGPDGLHELLAASDFVVVTAPLTSETKGMLDEAAFRAMKPGAIYVCVSRGAIADEAALLRALREGWIAGAALDAHAVEPLPSDSPFWDMPNVLVTPHNAGTSLGTAQRGVDIFVENLTRFRAGASLVNEIVPGADY